MESTFYITHRFPCGHSVIYEHPVVVLRKMTRAGLVPRDQEFSQITVHLSTSDSCTRCPTKPTTTTSHIPDHITKQRKGLEQRIATQSLLKHTFCCDHNMRRPMHESVLAKLRNHQVVPPGHGSGEEGGIILEVESSYCEACQEAKMREVHESLDFLKQDLGLNFKAADDHAGNDEQLPRRRREDELRDVFLQLEGAQLTAELAPRHFRGSLRVFAGICVEAVTPPERLWAWVQTLTSNDYLAADVQKAIEERLAKK